MLKKYKKKQYNNTEQNIIKKGDITSGKPFYYKLQKKTYHTLLIKSNYSIFFEIRPAFSLIDISISAAALGFCSR